MFPLCVVQRDINVLLLNCLGQVQAGELLEEERHRAGGGVLCYALLYTAAATERVEEQQHR